MKSKLGIVLMATVLLSLILVGGAYAGTATVGIPGLGNDDAGGHTWLDSGNNYIAWGFDLDCAAANSQNTSYLGQQMDAAVYCNSNFVSIPVPWKVVEPTQNNYSYAFVDTCVNMARSRGLKVVIQWLGMNYASGDNSFVPTYVIWYPATYTHIQGPGLTDGDLCPSDPDTLAMEKAAYYGLLNHLRTNNPANTVMVMETTGETDYVGAVQSYFAPCVDVRCTCAACNSLYAGQGNVAFMKTQFCNYIKGLIDYGASIYDIPTFDQVCPWSWFNQYGGSPASWRYAEDPGAIKATVNRWNNIVGPSVTNVTNPTTFVNDMNYFWWTNISGNRIFTDGIDSGAHINDRVECAPWYSIMYYGGMGAMYWDCGQGWPQGSILNNTTLREKCRKYFGPLKGIQYHMARLKSNTLWGNMGSYKFWWTPGTPDSAANTSGQFWFHQTNSGNEYGAAFQLGQNDICFTGSTYGGSYTMAIDCATGWSGYVFEKGSFDPVTGGWTPQATVYPTINGNRATLTISDDSGVWWNVVYRYHSLNQAGGYYRIKNRWTGEYLTIQDLTGKVQCCNMAAQNNWAAQWYIEDAGGYVRFRNRWNNAYMHIQNLYGWVQYGTVTPDQWSAHWSLENYAGNYRIKNRWQSNQYIHNNSLLGYAQCGTLGSQDWWSAQWSLEEVQ